MRQAGNWKTGEGGFIFVLSDAWLMHSCHPAWVSGPCLYLKCWEFQVGLVGFVILFYQQLEIVFRIETGV